VSSLLIDTQVFVWLINEDTRLSNAVLQKLSNTSNRVCVSYFSFFEMTIKASLGKLTYDSSVLNDLTEMGLALIMPSEEALRSYTVYNHKNRDPFDNMLITVARIEKCTFVTSDRKILSVSAQGFKSLNATT
jgi:PIN domain nuclease of toxin-antitoxin system